MVFVFGQKTSGVDVAGSPRGLRFCGFYSGHKLRRPEDLRSQHGSKPERDRQDAEKKYVARAYNFYVFPEKGFINMEATSIHFNSKNGVDS